MQFTASDGKVIPEGFILRALKETISVLKNKKSSVILSWEREFLEWYLDKKIEFKRSDWGILILNYMKTLPKTN